MTLRQIPTFATKGLIVKEINDRYLLVEDEKGNKSTYGEVPFSKLYEEGQLTYNGRCYKFMFDNEKLLEMEDVV